MCGHDEGEFTLVLFAPFAAFFVDLRGQKLLLGTETRVLCLKSHFISRSPDDFRGPLCASVSSVVSRFFFAIFAAFFAPFALKALLQIR
jgi:hypothetical protein